MLYQCLKYDNVECAFVINGQQTEWFRVKKGMGQSCLLLPILFSVLQEFVMADLKSLCKEFKVATNFSFDIRYADDTIFMSSVFEKLQVSNVERQAACRKRGMKINFSQCKVIIRWTSVFFWKAKN